MHKDILSSSQKQILGLLSCFKKRFYLAGGTAIALRLGHRKSIDFDLFSVEDIDKYTITMVIKKEKIKIEKTLVDTEKQELTIVVHGVKVTFLQYPFTLPTEKTSLGINIPSLLTLGAMKCYTLGRRGKWKDYVDIYTILHSGITLEQLCLEAEKIFEGSFNQKLLREQLCYFEDIDFSEEVEYMGGEIAQEKIQKFLIQIAIT